MYWNPVLISASGKSLLMYAVYNLPLWLSKDLSSFVTEGVKKRVCTFGFSSKKDLIISTTVAITL